MRRGFTLLELLVVLAVIGLVMVAVPMMMAGGRPGPETRAAALEIASALRQARGESIARFRPVTFLVDVDQKDSFDGIRRETPRPAVVFQEVVQHGTGGARQGGSGVGGQEMVEVNGHQRRIGRRLPIAGRIVRIEVDHSNRIARRLGGVG